MKNRMKRMVTAACAAIFVLMLTGMKMEVNAEEHSYNWIEGNTITIKKGDSAKIELGGNESIWVIGNNKDPEPKDNIASIVVSNNDSKVDWYQNIERVEFSYLEHEGQKRKGIFCYSPKNEEASTPVSTPAVSSGSSCSHNFEWNTEKEATALEDGLASWKCTKCGQIDSWMNISAYHIFNVDAAAAIAKAEANATVTINTRLWESFHKSVLEKLAARLDVTVTINYTHQHKNYTVTIPAGTDTTKLADENGYCGFRYLDSVFYGSEVVK